MSGFLRTNPKPRKQEVKRERHIPAPMPVEHRRAAVMVTRELLNAPAGPIRAPVVTVIKSKVHRDPKLRESAKGEACLMRLPGCIGDTPGAVIASHYRGSAGGKAMGLKSSDHAIAYACTHCDAAYDGQIPRPAGWTDWMVKLAWHEAHVRTLVRLHEKGLL